MPSWLSERCPGTSCRMAWCWMWRSRRWDLRNVPRKTDWHQWRCEKSEKFQQCCSFLCICSMWILCASIWIFVIFFLQWPQVKDLRYHFCKRYTSLLRSACFGQDQLTGLTIFLSTGRLLRLTIVTMHLKMSEDVQLFEGRSVFQMFSPFPIWSTLGEASVLGHLLLHQWPWKGGNGFKIYIGCAFCKACWRGSYRLLSIEYRLSGNVEKARCYLQKSRISHDFQWSF